MTIAAAHAPSLLKIGQGLDELDGTEAELLAQGLPHGVGDRRGDADLPRTVA